MIGPSIGAKIAMGALALIICAARTTRARPDGDYRLLSYSVVMRIIAGAVVGGVGYLSVTFYVINEGALSTLMATSVLFLIALALLCEVLFSSARYNSSEVITVTPWTGRRVARWSEVEKIRYDEQWNQIVVSSTSGKKVRIQRFLSGVPELVLFMAKVLPEKMPPNKTS